VGRSPSIVRSKTDPGIARIKGENGMSLSNEILNVIHEVRHKPVWSIVLVPKSVYHQVMVSVASLCDAEMDGRTIRWEDRPGKLTIVHAGMDNPVPKGSHFDLYLTAWHSSTEKDRALSKPWVEAARHLASSNTYNWDQTPLSSDPKIEA
jgi:hypothetical protein